MRRQDDPPSHRQALFQAGDMIRKLRLERDRARHEAALAWCLVVALAGYCGFLIWMIS